MKKGTLNCYSLKEQDNHELKKLSTKKKKGKATGKAHSAFVTQSTFTHFQFTAFRPIKEWQFVSPSLKEWQFDFLIFS